MIHGDGAIERLIIRVANLTKDEQYRLVHLLSSAFCWEKSDHRHTHELSETERMRGASNEEGLELRWELDEDTPYNGLSFRSSLLMGQLCPHIHAISLGGVYAGALRSRSR